MSMVLRKLIFPRPYGYDTVSHPPTDHLCRHHAGYRNAVSADLFVEQTAIKMGKDALRGGTKS